MAIATPATYRLPDPLRVTGSDIADNWRRFKDQWLNYVVAADLSDASSEKRAAVFLTCVGSEAYDVFRAMHFASDDDRKQIEHIITGFETFCVGAVNETYTNDIVLTSVRKTSVNALMSTWAKYDVWRRTVISREWQTPCCVIVLSLEYVMMQLVANFCRSAI